MFCRQEVAIRAAKVIPFGLVKPPSLDTRSFTGVPAVTACASLGCGVDQRQIRRYEAGQMQPALSVAVAIARALGISVKEPAGLPTHRVDLSGDWWASWQTFKDGEEIITAQEVRLVQHDELIQVHTLTEA